jgi:hypothetical protein
MAECKIGPIEVDAAHLREGNEQGADGTEKFSLFLENLKARQVMGLSGEVNRENYGQMAVLSNKGKWGPIPVDTSTSLLDNDNLRHRGYYLLRHPTPKLEYGPKYLELECECEKIADLGAYLNMDYTRGINDDTIIPNNYNEQVLGQTYKLQDPFDTFDTTTNWDAAVSSGLTSQSIISSGGKLTITGTAVSGVWGGIYTLSKAKFTPPYTIDFTLEWVAQPAGNPHQAHIMLYPTRPGSYSQWAPGSTSLNWLLVSVQVTSTDIKYYIQKRVDKKTTNLINPVPLTTSQKVLSGQIKVDKNGKVEVWIDPNGGTNYSKKWGNADPGIGLKNGAYITMGMSNKSGASATVKMDYCNVYNNVLVAGNNVVTLPVGTTLETSASFNRPGAEGNIPCYIDPLIDLYFKPDMSNFANYYKGSVKAYNSNYEDDTARLITGNDDVLDPLKFNMDNTLIKLVTTASGVEFYYNIGGGWVLLNTFTTGTIRHLEMVYTSPEKCVLQINRSYLTMWRGKQFIMVEHPNNSLGFTRKTCYDHDDTVTTDPAANADITMQDLPYCNIWSKGTGSCTTPDPVDRYRLQIIKTTPVTIKSDSIPADDITGIGFYDSNITPQNGNGALFNCMEFFTQTEQIITIKRP